MAFMFHNATHFNQPIGKWNTSKVTDMSFMFTNATNFNQELKEW
ncbi:bacterial surface protein 26-residue repeat, partial [Metamycoplasma alkalescens]